MSEIDKACEVDTVLEIIDYTEQADEVLLLPEASLLLDEALLQTLLEVGGLREIQPLQMS
jgi:hypothetical protein